MKMMFIGAAHEVTGSCTYIEACGKRFLVDFGMQQGEDMYENVKIPTALRASAASCRRRVHRQYTRYRGNLESLQRNAQGQCAYSGV